MLVYIIAGVFAGLAGIFYSATYTSVLPGSGSGMEMNAIAAVVIGGTSLSVYPAAGFIDLYRGHRLVLVNKSATPRDSRADLIVRDPIGQAFAELP